MGRITQDNRFYVYQYINEATGLPYYVGKGTGRRINQSHKHIPLPSKEYRQVIQDGLKHQEALDLEVSLIRKYGRKVNGGILDNIKVNRWACIPGWHHSEDTKQRISKKTLGVKKSDETKERMRQAQLNQSLETRQKIRNSLTGVKHTEERKEKNRQSAMKPEVREAKRQKMLAIIASRKLAGLGWGGGKKNGGITS